jgi:D-glycero-beta-D-manno-heptose-7-phosphate kinase
MANFSSSKILQALKQFPKQKILVVGDLMLDLYVQGPPRSVSQEAPVVIVRAKEKFFKLGGAANVAENITSLGGRAFLCGVIGDHNKHDDYGRSFLQTLRKSRLPLEGIFVDHSRPTTLKMRIMSQGQQLVRVDEEQTARINKSLEIKVLRYIKKMIPKIDTILVSDYNKGVITSKVMRTLVQLAKRANKKIIVDPKPQNVKLYQGVDLITPNEIEISMMFGEYEVNESRTPAFAKRLQREYKIANVLLTRGERGMVLVNNTGKSLAIPALAKKVIDVSGAGDTVISVMSLGINLLTPQDLAYLAAIAAKCSVEKQGTATVLISELISALRE